ncbi:MAG: helix-turn-helix domain-containing protein [Planctomycetota bacterium]
MPLSTDHALVKLSLADAATILGRSPRQLRYMIRAGKIRAAKTGTRWQIESDDLPLTVGQRVALRERAVLGALTAKMIARGRFW